MKSLAIPPYIVYLYRQHSKLTMLGLGFVICALVLFVFNQTVQQRRLDRINAELMKLLDVDEFKKTEKIASPRIVGIIDVMALHKKSELLTIVEEVQDKAKDNNIHVGNIEYAFSALPLIDSLSYELTFSARGQYLNFRKFLSQLTKEHNGVVLQHVEFSRENKQVNELEGFLKLAIYVQNQK